MSRVTIVAEITVYQKDHEKWGTCKETIRLGSSWNDDRGDYVVLRIGDHSYTVVARDLRGAIQAVTTR